MRLVVEGYWNTEYKTYWFGPVDGYPAYARATIAYL
jgi:hypothetical protein